MAEQERMTAAQFQQREVPEHARKPAAKPNPGQDVEDALWRALGGAGLLEGAERQFHFARAYGRKWRADIAYPAHRLLVECEGQVHAIKARRIGDLERSSVAAVLGYRIVRCDRTTVQDGRAVEWVRACLKAAP